MSADAAPAGTPEARRSSRLKWALIASLAINLLILGSMAGHRYFGHSGPWRGARGDEVGLMGYARTLDKDRRTAIRRVVQADRPAIRALHDELRKARIAASEVLAAEPFDKEKARAALLAIGEAEARMKAAGLNTFLAAAEQMSPDERAGLVEWWKRRRPNHFREPPPWREKRKGGRDEDDGER